MRTKASSKKLTQVKEVDEEDTKVFPSVRRLFGVVVGLSKATTTTLPAN